MTLIGVISDTHGLLRSEAVEELRGVSRILHAGDVGTPEVLAALNEIAPVTAVMGNTDEPGLRFRQTELVEFAGRKFLLHHIVNPRTLEDDLRRRITREKPDVDVFGHTHKPFCESIGGVLYFNPGYAGKSRFGMERSVAILHCDKHGIRQEYFRL